jgi:mono/diheme cytochrome c family protein
MRTGAILCALAALALVGCGKRSEDNVHDLGRVDRELDSAKGRELFVSKGCVICHSANGVGGKAATPFDAEVGAPPIDPLDFAARMWRGAPAMIELQGIELGYTIDVAADDIAHLSAFAADREEQKKLTADQLPPETRDSLLDERFWEVEDWDEFLKSGQEGMGEPEPPESSGDEPQ